MRRFILGLVALGTLAACGNVSTSGTLDRRLYDPDLDYVWSGAVRSNNDANCSLHFRIAKRVAAAQRRDLSVERTCDYTIPGFRSVKVELPEACAYRGTDLVCSWRQSGVTRGEIVVRMGGEVKVEEIPNLPVKALLNADVDMSLKGTHARESGYVVSQSLSSVRD